jgi:hypothetical protein
VTELHTPAVWHWSLAAQITGLLPTQLPDWQLSVCVHAFPSLHDVPLLLAGVVQIPVVGLHTPVSWQESLGEHITGLLPTQTPD